MSQRYRIFLASYEFFIRRDAMLYYIIMLCNHHWMESQTSSRSAGGLQSGTGQNLTLHATDLMAAMKMLRRLDELIIAPTHIDFPLEIQAYNIFVQPCYLHILQTAWAVLDSTSTPPGPDPSTSHRLQPQLHQPHQPQLQHLLKLHLAWTGRRLRVPSRLIVFDGRGPVHLAASVCFHSWWSSTLLQAVSLLLT